MLSRIKNWLFPGRVDTPELLEDLLSVETSRLSQRSTVGFCHTKAGSNARFLFREKMFLDALEVCRWNAFAMLLADLCMIVEAYLRPQDGLAQEKLWTWLEDVYVRTLDKQETQHDFSEFKRLFAERLGHARLAPPGRAVDQVTMSCKPIYDSLPIHETLRGDDFEVIDGLLHFGAATFRETLEQRCDPSRVVEGL